MPHAIGIIQARMGSSRLGGKILLPLNGLPLLNVLASRLSTDAVDEWWLATTRRAEDAVTAMWGDQLGLRVYRGEEEDVLSRFTAIIRERRPQWVVRITADNPFTDGHIVRLLLERAEKMPSQAVLVGQSSSPWAPIGYVPSVARAAAVLEAEHEIPSGEDYHRSHVLSWLASESGASARVELECPPGWPQRPQWRWTVDTVHDALMARQAFALFGEEWSTLTYPQMVALLDQSPEVAEFNQHVRQKRVVEG